MTKGFKFSIAPAVAALGAFFLVLPTGGADVTVSIVASAEGWAYSPAEITVEAGQRVSFTNDSGTTHTAGCIQGARGLDTEAGQPLDCSWSTGDVQPAETVFVDDLSDQGIFLYVCRYHPETMRGAIRVT